MATLTFDPTVPERVVYSILYGGANLRTWIGDHTAFMAGANATINLGSGFGDMTYGENGWLVTGDGYVLYADDMMSIVRAGATSTGTRHTRAGISGTTIHWVDPGNTIAVGTDDCTSLVHGLGEILGSAYLAEKFLVCDPIGEIVLTVNNSTLPVRSIDDGTTFTVISGLPSAAFYFAYIDGVGASSRWVAVGSAHVYCSEDGGVSWSDRTGDLTDIIATPILNIVNPINTFQKVCFETENKEQSFAVSLSTTDPLSIHIEGGIFPTSTGYGWMPTTDPDVSIATHIPIAGVRFVGFEIDADGNLTLVDGIIHAATETPNNTWLPVADAGNTIFFFVLLYADIQFLCNSDFVIVPPFPSSLPTLFYDQYVYEVDDDGKGFIIVDDGIAIVEPLAIHT